jgi:hypothetical protein
MGDVGDFWNDVRAANRAAGLPSRRKRRQRAEPPTKQEMREYAAAGFRQCSEWHWQRRLGDDVVDWWPSTSKWMIGGKVTVGPWAELKALVSGKVDA